MLTNPIGQKIGKQRIIVILEEKYIIKININMILQTLLDQKLIHPLILTMF